LRQKAPKKSSALTVLRQSMFTKPGFYWKSDYFETENTFSAQRLQHLPLHKFVSYISVSSCLARHKRTNTLP